MQEAGFVCAIFYNNDRKILLQKRIVEGVEAITVFGGHLRKYEDFIPGLDRQLREELRYEIDKKTLVEIGDFQRNDKEETVCKLFLIKNDNIVDLRAQEGEVVLLDFDVAFDDIRLTNTTREMIFALKPFI